MYRCLQFILFVLLLKGMFVNGQVVNKGEIYIAVNAQVSVVNDLINASHGHLINDGTLSLFGDIENNGEFDFVKGGLVAFVGENSQNIYGKGTKMFLNNVLLNKEKENARFKVKAAINILGKVYFEKGYMEMYANNDEEFLDFFDNATHVNGSDKSHVIGFVDWHGTDEFVFPVGNGKQYRPIAISGLNGKLNGFRCSYIVNKGNGFGVPDETVISEIDFIDNVEYWEVKRLSGNNNDKFSVTLKWDVSTTPKEILDSPDNVHVVRWDENKKKWIDEGGMRNGLEDSVTAIVSNDGLFTLALVNENNRLEVYNAISMNGNDLNHGLVIENLKNFSQNRVRVYNRWGQLVFNMRNYNNMDRIFNGYANTGIIVRKNDKLPSGTYYYTIEYIDDDELKGVKIKKKVGYLYLLAD
ncbi:gliding motility-associated C-terminal domain-containing protein [Flagellimonas onchidii]|uniref:gliding motility-associated C-terminal domain-containing protein n=1 Tax=Flagellimonas onchidii TaxID=2562684 RepID=UPI0014562001|nr:gliding motility-associated C-terminal domain-containing protein [Allomuricauda onchidii]